MKKKIPVNKDVFKRVYSPKETREFTISERVTKTNAHQHNTDFVASQQRSYNTRGKEGEVEKGGEPLSRGDGRSAVKPSASSNASAQTKVDKVDTDQRARLEALKRTQKNTLTASVIPPTPTDEAASPKPNMDGRKSSGEGSVGLPGEAPPNVSASQADMGHHVGNNAGTASLDGKAVDQTSGQADLGHHVGNNAGTASLDGKAVDQTSGQADLGHHVGNNAGTASLDGKAVDQSAGQADLGHHVGNNAGTASLDGKAVDQTSGQADLGHQESKNSNQVSLTGRDKAPVSLTSMDPTRASEESQSDVTDASFATDIEASALPSRLAEKMSKIRSKTDDITNESEGLQDSNRKP